MGRRRIELVITPQDTRPEQRSKRTMNLSGTELEVVEEDDPLFAEGQFSEPAWSFYLSRTTFEAIGKPTVGCEIMVTLSTIR